VEDISGRHVLDAVSILEGMSGDIVVHILLVRMGSIMEFVQTAVRIDYRDL